MSDEYHAVQRNLQDETTALDHAEREWNPLRVVTIGAAHAAFGSGNLVAGTQICVASARDTRTAIMVANLSDTDDLIVTSGRYQYTKGTNKVTVGAAGFPIPAGKSFTIPTRDEVWVSAPTDAASDVPYGTVECFD